MKNKFTLLLSIILFAAPYLFAQKQTVFECSNKRVKDLFLQNAIQKSFAGNPSIGFLTDDSPCSRTRHITTVLNRTINKQYFNLAVGQSFSLIKNGEDFFSVERFVFKNNQTAALISKALNGRSNKTLQIKSLTGYDFFVIENNLIFFIADRQIYQNNKPLFYSIKNNFEAEYKSSRK